MKLIKLFLGLTTIAIAAVDGKCEKMTIRKEMNGKDCFIA